jgi:hypothetical protein
VASISRVCGKKKPYQRPNLRVYGDVRALTQAAGMTSKNGDGTKGLKTR